MVLTMVLTLITLKLSSALANICTVFMPATNNIFGEQKNLDTT